MRTIKSLDSRKTRMRSVEEALDYAESIVETVREPLIILDTDLWGISALACVLVEIEKLGGMMLERAR